MSQYEKELHAQRTEAPMDSNRTVEGRILIGIGDGVHGILKEFKTEVSETMLESKRKLDDTMDTGEANITEFGHQVEGKLHKAEEQLKTDVASTVQNVDAAAEIARNRIAGDLDIINRIGGESVKETRQKVEAAGTSIIEDVKDQKDKATKKGGSFLSKVGKKFSGKAEEIKDQVGSEGAEQKRVGAKVMKDIESDFQSLERTVGNEIEEIPEKTTKKSFLGKLGRKVSGKGDELKVKVAEGASAVDKSTEHLTKTVDEMKKDMGGGIGGADLSKKSKVTDIASGLTTDISQQFGEMVMKGDIVLTQEQPNVKQKTVDFLESESLMGMTRAVSDYGSQIKTTIHEPTAQISEANIDLSNLPTNVEYPTKQMKTTSSYVSSPTSSRRTHSTRFPKGERPDVIEITYDSTLESSSDDSYIVTEPDDEVRMPKRSALFHIESEEDNSCDVLSESDDRRSSAKSNVLETLSEDTLGCVLTDLNESVEVKSLEEHRQESQSEIELIEKKLRDLDKALDSLEKVDSEIETKTTDDSKTEKKLRRIERKFERMASEVMDKETEDGKEVQMTSPEIEEKREADFRKLASQISVEEISDFQKEYSHLWDEHTFSKSSDWESKTPDSQADAQELPQGEIVYMGPVKLNKGHLLNKAGIEVDVIPIMRSPCHSPKPRNKSKRAKSAMSHYRDKDLKDDHSGSLPDLKTSPLRGSLLNTVVQMGPRTFLSTDSLSRDEHRMTRSLGSTESLPKGAIVGAVMNWLQKSSPFSSTDNIDKSSFGSIADVMETSISIFDDDEMVEVSDYEFLTRSEREIPQISVETEASLQNDAKPLDLEISCDQPNEAAVPLTPPEANNLPKPKPRAVKTPETQTIEEPIPEKPLSPVRDDLLDDVHESYSDKKKFWESVTKDASHKRMSLQETTISEMLPPVPKPRTVLQSSQSMVESEHEVSPKPRPNLQSSQSVIETDDYTKVSVKDRAISFESSTSDSSGLVHTDLTRITESDTSFHEEKVMSEYQASFQPPIERKTSPKGVEQVKFQKVDSTDSDKAQKGSSLIDNTGYISDSEDVEHYISDSEIEDRVPQIRDRLMSVFVPSASSIRKPTYERSASLPTEDMYEVSARSIKARKAYYEEQIRKEMIEEQLTSEIEEEPSPERKNLVSSAEDEHTDADARSICEDIEEIVDEPAKSVSKLAEVFEQQKRSETVEEKASSVKTVATSFEGKVSQEEPEESTESREEKREDERVKTSVKDLAKGYEKQLGNVIAGHKIGQPPIETKGFVLDKLIKGTAEEREKSPHDIVDFIEVTHPKTPGLDENTHKAEDGLSISPFTQNETHKEIEVERQILESQQSVSSDRSCEMTKDDSHSTKPDSMEVLVDKSEIEDTEKIAELDQDLEGRSTDSHETESPKMNLDDEGIPEITFTLSGKQRRISEESDEYADHQTKPPVEEKSGAESPIKVPQESVQNTVWEVSVESHSGNEFEERVEEIDQSSSMKLIQEFIASERMIEGKTTSTHESVEVEEGQEDEVVDNDTTAEKHPSAKGYEEGTVPTEDNESGEKTNAKKQIITEDQTEDIRHGAQDSLTSNKEHINEIKEEVTAKSFTDEYVTQITEDTKSEVHVEKATSEVDKEDFEEMMDQQEVISDLLGAKLKQQSLETPTHEHSADFSDESRGGILTDDLSSSVRDESDLGSEIHQDHSDSCESDKIKSESHSDIKKIILDSLHQQKVHPEEAKKIASALVEEIETEIHKRESQPIGSTEKPVHYVETKQVSEFLKNLAETKGLDEREVELVESVLARRQRELSKLTRGDTQGSSMEITDEDLRYSGTETDYSHILEQQMDQLEAEKIDDIHLDFDSFEEQSKRFQDKSGFVDKIDEGHCEETESSHDYESYENSHITSVKKDVSMKSSDAVKGEKSVSETKNVIFSADKKVSETLIDEKGAMKTFIDMSMKEKTQQRSDDIDVEETKAGSIKAIADHTAESTSEQKEMVSEDLSLEKSSVKIKEADSSIISAKYDADSMATETIGDHMKEMKSKTEKEYDEVSREGREVVSEKSTRIEKQEDGSETETKLSVDKTHTTSSSKVTEKEHKQEEITTTTTIITGDDDLEKLIASSSPETVTESIHEIVKRSTSSESKSSTESKYPEDSSKKEEKSVLTSSEVVFRKAKSDVDTSSSSSNLKPERKSGVEFEAYSSSGESHYHSFEIDSGRSRPCSSDVEGLVVAGSSEYESALTSQEYSARSHITSTEYQSAVSSMSSKESMKSLDSESSGNLASVEVSEHSETLVPSTSDLEDILDSVDQQLLDEVDQSSVWSSHEPAVRQSTEISDSDVLSYTGVGESVDVSEEDSSEIKLADVQSKMKRSHEMTFQPEPKVLVPESPQGELGVSLDDGSVLSMSSTSSTGAQRTVIELSRADSERFEGSMTVSGTSEHLSLDDVENMPRGSRESLIVTPTSNAVDISTSTASIHPDLPIESVTITTSTIDENGIQSVSTQVTSETQSPVEELQSICKPDEPRKKGHRRSDSSFSCSMINATTRAEVERKIQSELAESDKYTSKLSFKETSSDEKKDIDESEKEESYETEADQGFHRDLREGRYLDTESDIEPDLSRPHSHLSKSDSECPPTGFSDDRPDSELADLVKSSDITESTDPIERPASPEPCEEHKYDTPEFGSEAHVDELDQEYSLTMSRSHELYRSEIRKSISDMIPTKDILEKRDSHGKSSSTSSEKSSFEEAEAEAAFNMVAHISPAHKVKQICPILEDVDAEKHELETRERAQKEYDERRSQVLRDASPGFVPDIKITQHMTPLLDSSFQYPDLDLEAKEKEDETQAGIDTPQTPASNSSESSKETDQGGEYVLDESVYTIQEEPEAEKVMTESKSEVATVIESTVREGSEKGTDSPNSDSFEMLEKPDLIDDFVVIEEVGKEAHEFDAEGKSVQISETTKKGEKHDVEVEHYLAHSAPTPLTRMTDMKYYPDGTSSSEELGFDFEESPPLADQKNGSTKVATTAYGTQYDKELEANRKWIEQQFQGDQAAMTAAGYGYEMEFERGPLEDIKEEDVNDFAASSYGSQRDSGGSLKESYSSTPEYDVLAGRKFFTRSGEHDDVSMSSLQEFESLEQAMSLEMRKFHQGSQDSSSNGSFKSRYISSKGGQGDEISASSLNEFEGLEKACIAAHKIEIKVKEEEALLTHIEEGQESMASESESCETVSAAEKKAVTDTDDEEDYEKRVFEIKKLSNKLSRGDSIEEVSRVPDLDLDAPLVKSTVKVQWKEGDDVMNTSTDSLDLQPERPSQHDSTDSLDQKTGGDIMTASTDSIELQARKSSKDNIMTDSIEMKLEERSNIVSSDSLDQAVAESSGNYLLSDSIDEDGSRIGVFDHSSSSTGKDLSSSVKEDDADQDRDDYHLESAASTDVTGSTATHATYQFDTDSVFSGSFTSGGSNTMVSSTNSIDQSKQAANVDVAAAVRKVWFDEEVAGGRTTDYFEESSRPYVTEVIEPNDEEGYSHTIHRRVELPPEVRRVTFTGNDADERMKQFIQDFNEGEECEETEEVDEAGNVHVKKVVQRRFIVRNDGGDQPMSGPEIEEYFQQLSQPDVVQGQGVITRNVIENRGVVTRTITDGQGGRTTITQQFDLPSTQLTTLTRSITGSEDTASGSTSRETATPAVKPEGEEGAEKDESGHERGVADQHQLSEEMKALLRELEKESKQ
ncbi:hypothetical protein JTB14_038262 [Gonioctena quinquepunctata]|nr:hypothetical protein JTB14_038262 [Gonioctena quinquepunctata]